MADFRKWLMAFAVIVLLLGFGSTAVAQIQVTAPVTCTANSGTPRQIRQEGVAELVGDIVMNCTGGVQTPVGQPVPLANIRIAVSQPITSRSFAGAGEPMLVIDEPYPSSDPFPTNQGYIPGAPKEQIGCKATGGQTNANPFLSGTIGICDIAGVPPHVETYEGQYNTFQGQVTNNGLYIDFIGVPIDPPGSNYERIIRVTNVRADATKVPLGQTITGTVSVSGNASLTLPSPFTTVAFVYQGFIPGKVAPQNEVQCAWPSDGDSVGVTFAEGFASSFKTGLITSDDANGAGGLNSIRTDINTGGDPTSGLWEPQDLFGTGINYYTESGFTPNLTSIDESGFGSGVSDPLAELVEQTNTPGMDDGTIGTADYGTRFRVVVNNLQTGVALTFPVMPDGSPDSPNLVLQLIKGANNDGTGGSWATAPLEIDGSWTPTSGATTDYAFYEVVEDDPNLQESITVAAAVSYDSDAINLGKNIPALGANSTTSTSTMTVSFAPIAADTPGLSLLWNDDKPNTTKIGSLPRFIVTQAPQAAVILNPCSCNLLYPWIVSGSGFDTGMVVVNTSISPTIWPKQTSQSGTVTLWFTGTRNGASVQNEFHPNAANSPSEPAIWVPAGCSFSLIMSLGSSVNCVPVPSGEGSISTAVTTGFVGYIIATTTFQYCHGVAYVSPQNNPFQGSYYDAIELDTPFWAQHIPGVSNHNRTGQFGESQAH
ncbi:MAG: hypothetical protein ABSH47_09760 [Bryobacteraceae bacterium]